MSIIKTQTKCYIATFWALVRLIFLLIMFLQYFSLRTLGRRSKFNSWLLMGSGGRKGFRRQELVRDGLGVGPRDPRGWEAGDASTKNLPAYHLLPKCL